jgi:hypothetical protein
MNGHFEGSLTEKQAYRWNEKEYTKRSRFQVTIDNLPDVALLEIFDFYVDKARMFTWYRLVHVCRKWRNIVFGSPRRLDLRLFCTDSTPVRQTLNVWPLLPIVINVESYEIWDMDNVVAALEHNDRICELGLWLITSSQLDKVLAAMQQPFPALTHLEIQLVDETTPVIPVSFLGGSAPRLRTLVLNYIPFPGLPNLLLSATHLVRLELWGTPHSGYFSPETMITCLSVLTRLESLRIGFESPRRFPDRNGRLPLPTRVLLPVLTKLQFKGVGEYLEDLVARIDAPLLDDLAITFFHQLILDTSQLTQLISRISKFKVHDEARVVFSDWDVRFTLPRTFDGELSLGILCTQSDWQLSSLAQLCSSSFLHALIPSVEHLYILENGFSQLCWQDDIESSQWLELLHPFTAVKDLYISSEFTPRIARALTEVLPTLQNLFLEESLPSGNVQETIGKFVAARQLACHPIAVSHWERMSLED